MPHHDHHLRLCHNWNHHRARRQHEHPRTFHRDLQRATRYNAAPTINAISPTRRCSGLAPKRIASEITSATTGTKGPPGIVNAAGPFRRNAITEAQVPAYTIKRLTALLAANVLKSPKSARPNATSAVKTMAAAGVRNFE